MMSGPSEVAISNTLEAMAGRPCSNQGPRSITLPAPRALDAAFGGEQSRRIESKATKRPGSSKSRSS
jgi:hypothetical protein